MSSCETKLVLGVEIFKTKNYVFLCVFFFSSVFSVVNFVFFQFIAKKSNLEKNLLTNYKKSVRCLLGRKEVKIFFLVNNHGVFHCLRIVHYSFVSSVINQFF